MVSTWSDIAPAKEKLAGKRLNSAGMDSLNQPDADVRGDDPLMAKPGTRGMTKARVIAMLWGRKRGSD